MEIVVNKIGRQNYKNHNIKIHYGVLKNMFFNPLRW